MPQITLDISTEHLTELLAGLADGGTVPDEGETTSQFFARLIDMWASQQIMADRHRDAVESVTPVGTVVTLA